ncbi:MAG: carboxypeptidase-like regulatory domain-containing protein, partial [Bacteroidales bacterium]
MLRKTAILLLIFLNSLLVIAQEREISGKVLDSNGESLIGVAVIIKGTQIGTSTNFDGEFQLANVKDNSTLVVSYVGMDKQEVQIEKGKNIYDIVLKESGIALNELVVIGYGTTTKRKMVGSVSSVTSKQLERTPFSSVAQALQGQVPGLFIQGNGGSIGSAPSMSIRGGEEP